MVNFWHNVKTLSTKHSRQSSKTLKFLATFLRISLIAVEIFSGKLNYFAVLQGSFSLDFFVFLEDFKSNVVDNNRIFLKCI